MGTIAATFRIVGFVILATLGPWNPIAAQSASEASAAAPTVDSASVKGSSAPAPSTQAAPASNPQPEKQDREHKTREQKSEDQRLLGILDLIGKAFGWIMAAGFALLSYKLARLSAERTLRGARVNLLATVHKIYDDIHNDLEALRIKAGSDDKPLSAELVESSAKVLLGRFWGLQHAQFRYFVAGLVEDEDFKYWLQSRNRQFHSKSSAYIFGSVTYQSSWNKELDDKDFRPRFINMMRTCMDVGDPGKSSEGTYSMMSANKAVAMAFAYAKWCQATAPHNRWNPMAWILRCKREPTTLDAPISPDHLPKPKRSAVRRAT